MKTTIKASDNLEKALAEFERTEREFKQAAFNLSHMRVEVIVDATDRFKNTPTAGKQ